MACTWEHDDGRVCGAGATHYRVRWDLAASGTPKHARWWYCPVHLYQVRRMSSDVDARTRWGVATYPVVSA